MKSSQQSLAQALKIARQSCGLTLRQVEESTGISNAYLSQLENGRTTNPSMHMLSKLARLYRLPYSELMSAAGYSEESSTNVTTFKLAALTSQLNMSDQRRVEAFIRTLLAQRNETDNA